MKNLVLSVSAAAVIVGGLFTGSPALADDGPVGALGAGAATLTAAPTGMVIDSLYTCPVACSKSLAGTFGDENGWKQQIVGAVIGVPVGVVFGAPIGFCRGMHHAWNEGYDKPFSLGSFVALDSDK
jgi:hypothetical protein